MAKTIRRKAKSSKSGKYEGGDVITIQNVGAGAAVAAGRSAKASVIKNEISLPFVDWVVQTNKKIDLLSNVSQLEKEDLKQQIEKIGNEAQKGSKVEIVRLEKLINTLAIMAPDIFDVVVATLASPLAGIGLVIKKIGDKAKLERDKSKA